MRIILFLTFVTILIAFYPYWETYWKPRLVPRADKIVASILMKILPGTFQYRNERVVWNKDLDETLVWGFTNKHSIEPGQTFSLMLSTDRHDPNVTGQIEIYRIGFTSSGDRQLVWNSQILTVKKHNVSVSSNSIGPLWPAYISDIPTAGWTTGYYTFDFVNTQGVRNKDIAYIVVTPSEKSGDVLVKLSTNTYQAYNNWGGSSLYHHNSPLNGRRAHVVSFDRPTRSQFFTWEYFFVLWLEELSRQKGFSVHYATDFDIHQDARFTSNYKLVVSVGHDEYWSKEEFDHFYERIYEQGGNTLFLGANMAYWQVRYADVNAINNTAEFGRLLVCYKDLNDPIIHYSSEDPSLYVTAKFRQNNRRPETMLMGVGFESWFFDPQNSDAYPAIRYPFYVNIPNVDIPFFKNTGYQQGDFVGDLIGYEWDNTDPERDGSRLWKADKSKIALLPRKSLHVLFSGEVVDRDGEKGKAEAVYFETEAGAKVFSAGSIRWAWGLGKPGFEQTAFKQFNMNLVLEFLDLEY